MGILSALFGRNKLKKPNRENFFSVITAELSLSSRSDVRHTNKAGIVFNPVESLFFDNLDSELRNLLRIGENATGTRFEIVNDTYGTRWIVLEDKDFEDLIATMHLVSETIYDHGFADRLLAGVLGLEYEGNNAYWIYNYKRGQFYPLVLTGRQQRDNAAEMRLGTLMEEEGIPLERSLESWYALHGIPF